MPPLYDLFMSDTLRSGQTEAVHQSLGGCSLFPVHATSGVIAGLTTHAPLTGLNAEPCCAITQHAA